MKLTLLNEEGMELDFFHEVSKYAGYLRHSHISRHLAIFDLYKKTIELPGSVVEFGIYHGSTYFFLARLIEIFNHSEHEIHHSSSRHLFGFDSFEGFVDIAKEDNSTFQFKHRKVGGLKGDKSSFYNVLKSLKNESSIAKRLHIIEGDISETFDDFLMNYNGVRFCFCLLDVDVYKPTASVLSKIYDIMVPGGIIIFDEYGFPECSGETKAVDDFIKRYDLSLKAINWTFAPSAFCTIP